MEAPHALVLLGQPVAQSLSPVFQNAALQAGGLALSYSARDVSASDVSSVLAECARGRIAGNVTMPHKHAVFEASVRRTATAQRTGAVNTFWWEQHTLVGHNTDVDGIRATIQALCAEGIPGDVVLLGAGGSAAAVLVALSDVHPPVGRTLVVARTRARAEALVARVGARATACTTDSAVQWSRVALVINATPLGMHTTDPLPLDVSQLPPGCALFDLVYRQQGTALVQAARAGGLVAEDGLRMLVEQGASAFECWFNTTAPREEMWRSLGHAVPPAHAPRP